jgi:hypothetical protein
MLVYARQPPVSRRASSLTIRSVSSPKHRPGLFDMLAKSLLLFGRKDLIQLGACRVHDSTYGLPVRSGLLCHPDGRCAEYGTYLLSLCVIRRFDPALHEADEASLRPMRGDLFDALLCHTRLNQCTDEGADREDRDEEKYGFSARRHRQSGKEGSYVQASIGEASGMPKTASTNVAAISSSEYVDALRPARTTAAIPTTATPRTNAQRREW